MVFDVFVFWLLLIVIPILGGWWVWLGLQRNPFDRSRMIDEPLVRMAVVCLVSGMVIGLILGLRHVIGKGFA